MRSGGFMAWVGAALLAYAVWLGGRFSAEPGGSDASGYLNSARLLSEGRLETTYRVIPEIGKASCRFFQPLGFQADERSTRLVPTYPVGLPLHFAAAAAIFGWMYGPMAIVIGSAIVALIACYAMARYLGASPIVAAAGMTALAACAVFVHPSVQPYSDTVATMWCSVAIVAALRSNGGSRWNLLLCGAAVGLAVLVRPTNVVLCPAIALLLGDWRRILAVTTAALPWFIALALYNRRLYGSPFASGYGDVSQLFSATYVWPTLRHFALYVVRTLPFVATLAVTCVVLPWKQRGRELAALLAWIVALVALYSFYDYSRASWWFLRFIEPALPAAVALACVGLEHLVVRVSGERQRTWRVATAAAVVGASLVANATFRAPNGRAHDAMYAEAAEWLRTNVPENAVVMCVECSGMVYFRTSNPILRWDFLDNPRESARVFDALHRARRPVFALLVPDEVGDPRLRRFSAKWRKIADLEGITAWVVE